MLIVLFHILFLIVYIYLAVSTLYFLLFAIVGRYKRQTRFYGNYHKNRIAVLIPAYREDDIIVNTVNRVCGHNYPENSFQVIVIADSLKDQTLDKLRRLPVQLLEVSFDVSTKAKALHCGLQSLSPRHFDIAVILDADNIMDNGCLDKINDAMCNGRKAVQCNRVAKNEEGPVALLGAVSEAININLFRRGQAALGFSAAPLGSGMAFEFGLLKEIFNGKEILESAAEDREIDIQLLKRNIFMEFLDDAYIYDEKAANAGVFEKQRIRWFEAQWNHAKRFFKPDMIHEPKTLAYFNKLFQTLVLPRLLYFIIYGLVILTFALLSLFKALEVLYPSMQWWLSCMALYVFTLFVSIPGKFFNVKLLKAMAYIPVLMIAMLRAVLKMKSNRKGFLHTSKTFVEK